MSTPSATEILQRIAQEGHRLTRARRLVIQALAAAGAPLSVKTLREAMGPRGADLVTVYRTLHWLVELGLVRPVAAGAGAEHYELVPAGGHSHHLHCELCGAIRTVEVCGLDPAVFERIEREFGFSVEQHRLTFHGRCDACGGTS